MSHPFETTVSLLVFAAAWVGHACGWTTVLNNLYGRPLPKKFLKPWRLFTGGVIAAFPLVLLLRRDPPGALFLYYVVCAVGGGLVFPLVCALRAERPWPKPLLLETTTTLDLWQALGDKLIGDGKWAWCPRLPFNCVFRVDLTELTLAPPRLPRALDGITIHVLSDLHFHGSPSRLFFESVFAEVHERWPAPDLLCLVGDYVDTDAHREWVGPLLGGLKSAGPRLAILGNHDKHHHPELVRESLAAAGYRVLGRAWETVEVRGVPVAVIGHEGPWLPAPDAAAPPAGFRLCLSHTPDNFYWGQRHDLDLMLCGHVHGGQVRVPLIGPIFVPSVYGRRFDEGVFVGDPTVMVVNRGLSGKEPLRFRCHPQVVRLTLKAT